MTEDSLKTLFGDLTVVQFGVWLAALILLLVVIVRAWPKIRAFFETIDALTVLPAKLKLLDEIHHEVMPNTGTSLNDAVRRVEAEQKLQSAKLVCQSEKLDGLHSLMESADAELSERVDGLEDTLNVRKDI